MTAYEPQSVPATLDKMKMLFWRVDLTKRSFVNLNDCQVGVLGLENYRFFKDRDYREKMLFPDDRALLERTVASFKDRMPVRVVFRVQRDSAIHWFKLTGWPTGDYRYYEGAVEEITEHIAWLKNIFARQDLRLLKVDDLDYPVAVFAANGRRLLRANQPFLDLLAVDSARLSRYQLQDFVKSEVRFPQLLERLFGEGSFTEELLLKVSADSGVKSSCLFEYFTHEGEGYIRLALIDQPDRNKLDGSGARQPIQRQGLRSLCKRLAGSGSVDEMLSQIYAARDLFPGMDVVMFSDIYARKNRVFVYARGDMLEPLEPGSQFPYTGTIAENIEKENLEYLIVDDTQSSIKAIDWMLFVPKGIFSYIAKALYVRGAMRTVLIFCSREKNTFKEEHVAAVTEIATAFHQQLKQLRKSSGNK